MRGEGKVALWLSNQLSTVLDWIGARNTNRTIFEWALLGSPIFLFMSHSPAFLLSTGGESLRITPALVYILTLAVLATYVIVKNFTSYRNKMLPGILVIIALAYSILSLIWTPDLLRGIFNVALNIALSLIFFGALLSPNIKKTIQELAKVTIIVAVIWCIFAWFEFWFGLFNQDSLAVFCNNCSALGFGFVRPAGLMFEPQILGNFLLAPLLMTTYYILRRRSISKCLYVVLFIIMITIFMTLSRGAIYVSILGIIGMALTVRRPKVIMTMGITLVCSMTVAVCLQGFAASINPNTPLPFINAVNSVVEQLSMGRVSIPPVDDIEEKANSGEADSRVGVMSPSQKPMYDGYVEISTDHRLSMTELSLQAWSRNLFTMIFGTGTGSGAYPIGDGYDTVQNQHIEILLNYGVIGYGLFTMMICMMFVYTRNYKHIWVILFVYIAQWWFFSGLPHGFFHVYFVMAACVLYEFSSERYSLNSTSNN